MSACPRERRRAVRSEEHTSELQSHSDLPSFPTRRSSDLRNHGVGQSEFVKAGGRVIAEILERQYGHTLLLAIGNCRRERSLLRFAHRARGKLRRRCRRVPASAAEPLDRKSTRLNSSHTVICPLSLHDALPISVITASAKANS